MEDALTPSGLRATAVPRGGYRKKRTFAKSRIGKWSWPPPVGRCHRALTPICGMVASRAHLGALTTPIVDGPPVSVTGELSVVAVPWGLGRP